MKKLKWLCGIIAIFETGSIGAQDVPPNAQPGKCYTKCMIHDQYETKTIVFESKSGYLRWEFTPQQPPNKLIQVLMKPETKRFTILPAVYDTITERILVKPAFQQSISIPATYETVTETILVKPESKRIVEIPAIFETISETVLVKPEGKRLIPIAPIFETIADTIQSKPESKRFIEVPAQYETVTESYEAESPSEKVEILKPRFEPFTEQVKIREKEVQWVKKQNKNCSMSSDPNDCWIWCLVKVPAVYQPIIKMINKGCDSSGIADAGCVKRTPIPARMAIRTVQKIKNPATFREEIVPAQYATVSKQVLKMPATVQEAVIPAEFKTISRQVVKTPATFREEIIPAEFATITKHVLKTPATTLSKNIDAQYITMPKQIIKIPATFQAETVPAQYATQTLRSFRKPPLRAIPVPAEHDTYTYRQLVRKGGFSEWREIVCSSCPISVHILKLQKALNARGYKTVENNEFGLQTKKALIQFQKDRGFPIGNLDLETLKALGLNFKD
jgi:Putative peptidoglycan binding domain